MVESHLSLLELTKRIMPFQFISLCVVDKRRVSFVSAYLPNSKYISSFQYDLYPVNRFLPFFLTHNLTFLLDSRFEFNHLAGTAAILFDHIDHIATTESLITGIVISICLLKQKGPDIDHTFFICFHIQKSRLHGIILSLHNRYIVINDNILPDALLVYF